MLIAFKALGATALAGALTASGLITTGHLTDRDKGDTAGAAHVAEDRHAELQPLAIGAEAEVSAHEAGAVTVKRTESGLEASAVSPAAGWTADTKTLAADWVLVKFATEGRQVDLSLDLAGENLRVRRAAFDVDLPTTTTEPSTTTTSEPTTTTTEPPAPPPPPVAPTVVPVAGAGTVVLVVEGPVVVVREVKVVPGWVALVERNSGDVNVVFRRGERSFRFLAAFKNNRLSSDIREIRADGDRRIGFDGDKDRLDRDRSRDGRDGDRDGDRSWDRDRNWEGDRTWDGA